MSPFRSNSPSPPSKPPPFPPSRGRARRYMWWRALAGGEHLLVESEARRCQLGGESRRRIEMGGRSKGASRQRHRNKAYQQPPRGERNFSLSVNPNLF